MAEEKILSGEQSERTSSNSVISNEGEMLTNISATKTEISGLKDRIVKSTESGGLKSLPVNFDDQDGDWKIILTNDPFEILYLDYKQYIFIKPSIVENNYSILLAFWREKNGIMNTGGNRIAFKMKYGEGTVENSLTKIKIAYEKIKTDNGIEEYYKEINGERLRSGEENINDTLEQMMANGIADRSEIQLCLDRGLRYNLSTEETAIIINKHFVDLNFKPYETISGNTLVEKLLSVEHWMTPKEIDKYEQLKKEQEQSKIQILPGKYARTIKDIGTILFEDEREAKEIIKEDLLKPAIAQKDIVLARDIGVICKNSKSNDTSYLEVIYKLNPSLPYRFSGDKIANSITELCTMSFSDLKHVKLGKEHFKKGFVEIWLRESNKDAYQKFIKIRDTAENQELAFLEFIYTFNPSLPYRFAGVNLVKSPLELFENIDKTADSWEIGKSELYDNSIPIWLRTSGYVSIFNDWVKIRQQYEDNKDEGLEKFLHLLNPKAEYGSLKVDKLSLDFPAIQSGKVITTELVFKNETRGYLVGEFLLTQELEGVTLSSDTLFLNSAAGINEFKVILTIDTSNLLKGVIHETSIQLNVTNTNQEILIPVTFKIVFPKNAFIVETLKYAALLMGFFASTRWLIASAYPGWLNGTFNTYLGANYATQPPEVYTFFGWPFLFFGGGILIGGYYLIKYLISKK